MIPPIILPQATPSHHGKLAAQYAQNKKTSLPVSLGETKFTLGETKFHFVQTEFHVKHLKEVHR